MHPRLRSSSISSIVNRIDCEYARCVLLPDLHINL